MAGRAWQHFEQQPRNQPLIIMSCDADLDRIAGLLLFEAGIIATITVYDRSAG